jgi:exonuclease III
MIEPNNENNNYSKSWAGIKISSCNVSSLNLSLAHVDDENNTFRKKMSSILKHGSDIFLLQDTRVSNKLHILTNYINCTQWGNFNIFSNSSMNRRGVVTLINKSSNIEVIQQINSEDENCLILKLRKGDSAIVVANVYGPTQQEFPNFFNDLKTTLNRFVNIPIVISGDLNAISDTTKPVNCRDTSNNDLIGTVNIPNLRNSKLIEKWNKDGTFYDVFRLKNPNVKEYSYVSFNVASTQRSRIDLTLANEKALKIIKKTEYIFQPRLFDHKMQIIRLTIPEQSAPRPDMNNLDLTGMNEVIITTVINSYLEYTDWNLEDEAAAAPCEPHELHLHTPARIAASAEKLTGTLEIIKSKIRCEVSTSDLWLQLMIKNDIRDFWTYYNENIKLTFIENQKKIIDDSLFLQVLVNNLTNEIISFQTSMKKAENRKKDDLYKKLQYVLNESPINPVKMSELENQISEIEDIKIEKICKKNRAWQTLQNERGSKAFCSLNKHSGKDVDFDILLNCNVTPPVPFVDEEEKNINVNGYYIELFSCIDDKLTMKIDDFLGEELINTDFVQEKKLTIDEHDRLEEPITVNELRKTVRLSNSNSAPGFDGHSYAFIKKYLNYLETPMLNCFKLWISSEKVMHNFGISKVKLIPKKKELFNLKSWRPISLLSVYYKTYSGIVAERLKSVVDKITSQCQKSYSTTKNISEVNMDMVNLLKSANFSNTSLAVVSIDFRKAFDSISHRYIIDCLRFFGFGPYFIKLSLACIKGKNGYISNLKNSGETFSINCGVAQGDKPSGLFFNIVLEPLLILIQKCNILQDCMIKEPPDFIGPERPIAKRLFGYADDLNAIIKACIENIRRLIEILKNFYLTSGLLTNVEKTSVCPVLTDEAFENEILAEGLLIEKNFTLLGVKYDHRGENIDYANSEKIINTIQNISDHWDKFYISVPGKIAVVKTFFYSQIAYFAPFINFNDDFFSAVEEIIVSFINSDRSIGIHKCFRPTNVGGLGLFKVQDYVDGIKISFFRRHFSSNDYWATSIKNSRSLNNSIVFPNDQYLTDMFPASAGLCNSINRFAAEFFSYPGNRDQQYLLMNPAVRNRGEPLDHRLGSGLNIDDCLTLSSLRIRDLVTENNNPLTHFELNQSLGTNFPPRIHRILLSASSNIRGKFSPDTPRGPIITSMLTSKKKGSKLFRKYLTPPVKLNTIKNIKSAKTRQRWFNFDPIPTLEMKLLSSWTYSGFPNDMRERLMLIFMNLFKSNTHLSKFARDEDGQPPSPLCKNCELTMGAYAPPEDYTHLFALCPSTLQLNNLLNSIKRPEFSYEIHHFFVTDGNHSLNYAHGILMCLAIFHLSKLRNIITNRNVKIMNCIKESILDLCDTQKKFRLLIREILIPGYLDPG